MCQLSKCDLREEEAEHLASRTMMPRTIFDLEDSFASISQEDQSLEDSPGPLEDDLSDAEFSLPVEPDSHWLVVGDREFWVPLYHNLCGVCLSRATHEPWDQDMINGLLHELEYDVPLLVAIQRVVSLTREYYRSVRDSAPDEDLCLRRLFGMPTMSQWVPNGDSEFWIPCRYQLDGDWLISVTNESWTLPLVKGVLSALRLGLTGRSAVKFAVRMIRSLDRLPDFSMDEAESFDLRPLFGMEPLSHWVMMGSFEAWVPESYNISKERLMTITDESWTLNFFSVFIDTLNNGFSETIALAVAISWRRHCRKLLAPDTEYWVRPAFTLLFGEHGSEE